MTAFGFGQPDGGVVQMAYNVQHIEKSMLDFGQKLGTGPWFVMGPFSPPGAIYRGQPCTFMITLAFAFAGHMQIELLQQHDDSPSALKDRPIGFHHWGIGTRHFDAELSRHEAMGHDVIFTDQAPDGGRFAYVNSSDTLPGIIELIEMTPERDGMFTMMHQASVDWDGVDPVRHLGG